MEKLLAKFNAGYAMRSLLMFLTLKRVAAEFVPKTLNFQQKLNQLTVATDSDPKRIITIERRKRGNMAWTSKRSVVLADIFNCNGVDHCEFLGLVMLSTQTYIFNSSW